MERIGDGILAVMAKPVAGEWVEDEIRAIAQQGMHRIVSLLELPEEREVGLSEERRLAEKHGMQFLSYPIQDRGVPCSVQEFGGFVGKIYRSVHTGVNTVIHCRAGIGRTGLVTAAVLLHCGYKPLEAFALVSKKRGVLVPDTEEQSEWLEQHSVAILEYT